MSSLASPHIWTPQRAWFCPTCGKPRHAKRNPSLWKKLRRALGPLAFYAAGDILLDSAGAEILDASGNVLLSDGAGDACCCAVRYQARKCTDNSLASLYVNQSAFPSYPSTFYFYDLASNACYYVQSSDTAAAGSTPVATGSIAVGPGATGPCCTPQTCSQCTGNIGPDRFTATFSGISYASCLFGLAPNPAGNYYSVYDVDRLGTYDSGIITGCPGLTYTQNANCVPGSTICLRTGAWSDSACSTQIGSSNTATLRITYGGPSSENAASGASGIGWDVVCHTDSGQVFRGFTATAGDCFSPTTVTNTNGSLGGFDTFYTTIRVFGTSGSVVITPEA